MTEKITTSSLISSNLLNIPTTPETLTRTHVIALNSFIDSKDLFSSKNLTEIKNLITTIQPTESSTKNKTTYLNKLASRITNLFMTLFSTQSFLTSEERIQQELIPQALTTIGKKLKEALSKEIQDSAENQKQNPIANLEEIVKKVHTLYTLDPTALTLLNLKTKESLKKLLSKEINDSLSNISPPTEKNLQQTIEKVHILYTLDPISLTVLDPETKEELKKFLSKEINDSLSNISPPTEKKNFQQTIEKVHILYTLDPISLTVLDPKTKEELKKKIPLEIIKSSYTKIADSIAILFIFDPSCKNARRLFNQHNKKFISVARLIPPPTLASLKETLSHEIKFNPNDSSENDSHLDTNAHILFTLDSSIQNAHTLLHLKSDALLSLSETIKNKLISEIKNSEQQIENTLLLVTLEPSIENATTLLALDKTQFKKLPTTTRQTLYKIISGQTSSLNNAHILFTLNPSIKNAKILSDLNAAQKGPIYVNSPKKTRFSGQQPSSNAEITEKVPIVEGSTTVNLEISSANEQEDMKSYLADIISKGNTKIVSGIFKTLKQDPNFKNSSICVQNLINKITNMPYPPNLNTLEQDINTYSGYYTARFLETKAFEIAYKLANERHQQEQKQSAGLLPTEDTPSEKEKMYSALAIDLRALLQPIDEKTLSDL